MKLTAVGRSNERLPLDVQAVRADVPVPSVPFDAVALGEQRPDDPVVSEGEEERTDPQEPLRPTTEAHEHRTVAEPVTPRRPPAERSAVEPSPAQGRARDAPGQNRCHWRSFDELPFLAAARRRANSLCRFSGGQNAHHAHSCLRGTFAVGCTSDSDSAVIICTTP